MGRKSITFSVLAKYRAVVTNVNAGSYLQFKLAERKAVQHIDHEGLAYSDMSQAPSNDNRPTEALALEIAGPCKCHLQAASMQNI